MSASAAGSLAMKAYANLRQAIIRAELPPGHRFTEQSLVEELGIGKTPIREALGRLVQDGLVDSVPRVGYMITPITLRGVKELFEYRLVVEPASARLAAGRMTQEQEADARAIIDNEKPAHPSDAYLDQVTESNHRLHLIVAQASQNDHLVRAVQRTLEEAERLVRLVIKEFMSSVQHERLLDAVVAGHSDLAEEIASQHVSEARDQVIDAYLSSSTVMDAQLITPAS